MILPVSPVAHSFIHFSFLLAFIAYLTVSMEMGTSGCGHDAPHLAKVFTLSLPFIFTCLGIHCNVSLIACSLFSDLLASLDTCIPKL